VFSTGSFIPQYGDLPGPKGIVSEISGTNVVSGFENWAKDVKDPVKMLDLHRDDASKFELGRELGIVPLKAENPFKEAYEIGLGHQPQKGAVLTGADLKSELLSAAERQKNAMEAIEHTRTQIRELGKMAALSMMQVVGETDQLIEIELTGIRSKNNLLDSNRAPPSPAQLEKAVKEEDELTQALSKKQQLEAELRTQMEELSRRQKSLYQLSQLTRQRLNMVPLDTIHRRMMRGYN